MSMLRISKQYRACIGIKERLESMLALSPSWLRFQIVQDAGPACKHSHWIQVLCQRLHVPYEPNDHPTFENSGKFRLIGMYCSEAQSAKSPTDVTLVPKILGFITLELHSVKNNNKNDWLCHTSGRYIFTIAFSEGRTPAKVSWCKLRDRSHAKMISCSLAKKSWYPERQCSSLP